MNTAPAKKIAPGIAAITAPDAVKDPHHDWSSYNRRQRNSLLRSLAAFVLAPTLLAALYFGLLAADQYQTEVHISLRASQQQAMPSAFGAMLTGMSGMSQSIQDVRGIVEYLQSHDAVQSLAETADLRNILSHPDADRFTRLPENASTEKLREVYRDHIDAIFNMETSTVIVYVRAYSPQDAQKLAQSIISLSENEVNNLNTRAEEDALKLARAELARAENYAAEVRRDMVAFRETSSDINPTNKTGAIEGTIAKLEEERNKTQVELRELRSYAIASNPQLRTLQRRLDALNQQVKQEQARLTGASGATYTKKLSDYEELVMRQEMAQQAYASALVSLENARLEAQRQKSYVVPIVRPHMPQDATYPQRGRNILLAFIASLLTFGIVRLIIAGVRDHVMH